MVGGLFLHCERISPRVPGHIQEVVERVRKEHAPDPRVAIFDVRLAKKGDQLLIQGEVSRAFLRKVLLDSLQRVAQYFEIIDGLTVLPHPELGEDTCGVVKISVANLRREPKVSAEIVSQTLLGRVLRLLKRQDSWYLCQGWDQYIGWIKRGSLVVGDSALVGAWTRTKRVVVMDTWGWIREHPSPQALSVSDVVAGAFLKVVGPPQGDWLPVGLPDGRKGFIRRSLVEDYEVWQQKKTSRERILQTARSFLGLPYLWGGTSTKGFDCSGFVQTVYYLNGIHLPRDANQMYEVGTAVDPGTDFKNVRPGDLLFFGPNPRRITHVAIYLGGKRFIHSDDWVRINSLDPTDPLYNEYRHRTFRAAKRVLSF